MGRDQIEEVDEDQTTETLNVMLKNKGLTLQVSSTGELGRVPLHGIFLLTREVE